MEIKWAPACFLLLVIFAPEIPAQRSIPDDNLAYPVLVQFPDEQASGFYINTATASYLVTAKHVLFDPTTGRIHSGIMILLSYPRDPKESGMNVIQVDTTALFQAGEIKVHPVADVAVIHIADVVPGPPDKDHPGAQILKSVPGVMARTLATSGLLGVGIDAIKKYDDVLVANDVLLFGYPTSLGMKESPQLDPQRPLLRRGIVAGLNPSGKSIIIDCPSYPGNSGGPVVEIDREGLGAHFTVIGVVSQFVPFEEKSINYPISYQNVNISNSGYTIVMPMDFVLELVK
jgi:Trypsin-like peptidase domain